MRNKNRAGLSQAAFLGGISTMIAISLLAAGLIGTVNAPANYALPVVSVVPESRQVQEIKQTGLDRHIDPGALQIWDPKGPGAFCPLKGTEVVADVAGFGARVTVRQTFTNPSKSPIEAIYTFPLPADAAVDRMRFAVGNRIIEGQIKRREEARRIYEAAKNAGQAAALLDQERPNIFTQSVANVMPGQDVQVEISYVQLVSFKDDWFEFNFPMVVGPRFMGNAPDPNRIGTPIVKEGMRTGAGISVKVNLDAGGPIQEVQSVLHQIQSDNVGKGRMAIQLAKKDEIPNKDFILRYRLAGNSVRDAFFTHADAQKGGFFTLALLPPQRIESSDISPKEMIFVMDQSGSQSGFPIEKSKEMMRRMLQIMRPNDTFNVMCFRNVCNALWAKPLPNSQENRAAALQFINALQANGGTQLRLAIDKAMETPADPKRVRIIVFNTDGYVGDEFNILDTIQKNVGTARIFTFGIGNSVNRFLIDSMSAAGRGE
ncbi:MAG: VWA domain-containing protein, partial [Armatimonadetes bacterium]|nr:VWA domain-containing protein [Armatimonadota bacterium]